MITFEAVYDGLSRPKLNKIYTATSGEEFRVNLPAFSPVEEMDYVDEPLITGHMDNLISYSQYVASQISYADFGPNSYPQGETIIGAQEMNWILTQLSGFWSYMRYDRFASLDEEL